jgi:hypothetical protein
MSEEQELQFAKLAPQKSVLGREFLALVAERDKQKLLFESAPDKMDYDTTPYRRAGIALGRFLDDMIPLVIKHAYKVEDARTTLERAEAKAQYTDYHGIKLDRRSHQIIWTRFAIERYRLAIAKKDRKKFKMYHPQLWRELGEAWQEFRREIKRWQFGGMPYDGSQAMHSMISFQVKARLLASAND